MTIAPIQIGDADARAKINQAIAKANEVDSKASAAELRQETAMRTQAMAVLGAVIDGKASAAEIEARFRDASQFVLRGSRPGDQPGAFVSSIAGGDPAALPSPAVIARNAEGAAASIIGAGVVAHRRMVAIEPGRVYRVRANFRRTANPSDPAGDAVSVRVAWYDAGGEALSQAFSTIQDYASLSVAQGRQQTTALIGRSAQPNVTVVAPAGTAYARAYVQQFGGDAICDVDVLDLQDVSDLTVYTGSTAQFDARLTTVEQQAASAQVIVSSQAQAAAGTNNTTVMTPLRVAQATPAILRSIGTGEHKIPLGGKDDFGSLLYIGRNWRNLAQGLSIGGGHPDTGEGGVSIAPDNMPNWIRFQPTRNEQAVEMVVYPTAAQGNGRATVGTNQITRLEGTAFSAAWIGRQTFSFGPEIFLVSSVSGDTLTVTKLDGSSHTFASTYDETYHFWNNRGEGICNVNGTTVTLVRGHCFVPFFTEPSFRLWINGVPRTCTGWASEEQITISQNLGTLTNVPFVWELTVNRTLSNLNIQKLLGASEEVLRIGAYPWAYMITSQMNGFGRYRPIWLGAGEKGPGALYYQIGVQPTGDLTLGGTYEEDALRILARGPKTAGTTSRFVINPDTGNFGPNLAARSATLADVPMAFDTQGAGGFTFTSGSFGALQFQIFGVPGATSWLAVGGSTFDAPIMSATGAAANVSIQLAPKGDAGVRIQNDRANRIELWPAPAGFASNLRARGSDANVDMAFDTQGTGSFTFTSGLFSATQLQVFGVPAATSWLGIGGSASGAPSIAAQGAAANIDVALSPKGTGRLRLGQTFAPAASPASFTATHIIEIKDSAGTVWRVPARSAAW